MRFLVAAFAAAGAVLLVSWQARPRPASGGRPASPAAAGWLLGLAAGGAVLAPITVRVLAWTGVAALALGGSALLARRHRRARSAARARRRVLETCELLAAELQAGRPPGLALALAAEEWPVLDPVVESFSLGSDVPESLRRLAGTVSGAADLRLLGAAWQVAHRTGRGLAAAVELVADDLRAAQATRRVVESELASARATARLVAALPLLVLVMGRGAGGDPWHFLLATTPGLCCLAAGVALVLAGLGWIEAIAAGVWDP